MYTDLDVVKVIRDKCETDSIKFFTFRMLDNDQIASVYIDGVNDSVFIYDIIYIDGVLDVELFKKIDEPLTIKDYLNGRDNVSCF